MSTATVSGLVNWTFKESLGRPTRDYQTMRQPRRSPSGADDGADRCTFTTVDDGSDAGTDCGATEDLLPGFFPLRRSFDLIGPNGVHLPAPLEISVNSRVSTGAAANPPPALASATRPSARVPFVAIKAAVGRVVVLQIGLKPILTGETPS